MSNYAALRLQIIARVPLKGRLTMNEREQAFDRAWELVKGDEGRVEAEYISLTAPPSQSPAPAPVAPSPVPVLAPPTPLMVKLDHAAVFVIADALGGRTLFDAAARAQVLAELLKELRRLDVSIALQRSS